MKVLSITNTFLPKCYSTCHWVQLLISGTQCAVFVCFVMCCAMSLYLAINWSSYCILLCSGLLV